MNLSLTKLPWYAQIGAFAALAVVGVGAFYYFYEMPASVVLAQRQEELAGLRRNIAVGQATAKKLPEFRAQVGDLENRLSNLRAILPDEKLVFSWGAVDGWPELDSDRPEDSPLVTVTFSPTDRGTELRLDVKLPEGAARDRLSDFWPNAIQKGWGDTVDRLAGQF